MSKSLILVYLLKRISGTEDYQESTFFNISNIKYDSIKKIIYTSSLNENLVLVNSYIFKKYHNINNLSVIIGNNGAGKTTLLKNIRSFLDWSEHEDFSNLNNIGVFFDLDTNKFSYYSANQIDELEVKFNYPTKQVINKISEKNFKKLVSSKSIGYLTENFNSSDFFSHPSSNVYNNSPGKILNDLVRNSTRNDVQNFISKNSKENSNPNTINPITQYFFKETLNQIEFVISSKHTDTYLPFNLPKKIKIFFDSSFVKLSFFERAKHYLKSYYQNQNNNGNNEKQPSSNILFAKESQIQELSDLILNNNSNLFQNIQSHAILNYLGDMFDILHSNDIFNKNQYHAAKKNDISEITLENIQKRNINFISFLNRLKNTNITFDNIISIFETSFASTIFPVGDIVHIKMRYTDALQIISNVISVNNSTDIESIINYSINVDKSLRDDFFPAYFNISSQQFLNFSWDLSTGENHFLNLCSKILQLRKEYEQSGSNSKKLWLLIDEGNSSFHPEWQGRYVKTILEVASELLHDYSIQLFLTTHSPLVLSDIPHSNVVYINSIDNNNKIKNNYNTFGQNLYNLFSEVFSTSKTYGNLAADVFERLNSDLITIEKLLLEKEINFSNQTKQPNLQNIEDVVNIIGEKIIRYSFQDKISKLKDNGNTKRVITTFDSFKSMDKSEKETFIQYIIDLQKNEENLE